MQPSLKETTLKTCGLVDGTLPAGGLVALMSNRTSERFKGSFSPTRTLDLTPCWPAVIDVFRAWLCLGDLLFGALSASLLLQRTGARVHGPAHDSPRPWLARTTRSLAHPSSTDRFLFSARSLENLLVQGEKTETFYLVFNIKKIGETKKMFMGLKKVHELERLLILLKEKS